MKTDVYECIIIGGGLYCAAKLARSYYSGKKILIIEGGSRVGAKLALTGSGRCNLSNTEIDPSKYNTDDPERLNSCLNRYGSTDTVDFYENVLGVVLEQKGELLYPSTYKSSTVVDALRFYLADNNVEIVLKERVVSASQSDGIYEIKTQSDKKYLTKNLVIATGGSTYPNTGSDGKGLDIAEKLTDSTCIVPFKPALTSLTSDIPGIKGLCGIRCKGDVKIVDGEGTIKAHSKGEILFTKEGGISGICVMDVSDSAVRLIDEGDKNVKAIVNLTGRSAGVILQMILRQCYFQHLQHSDDIYKKADVLSQNMF